MKYLLIFTGVLYGLFVSAQDAFKCGESLKDTRNGKIYKTVLIGRQCWMATNLDIGNMVQGMNQPDDGIIQKTCYKNDPRNCKIYGGLYTWEEAMQGNPEEGSRGICPEGWHIPAKAEWQELAEFLDEDVAGTKLKVDKDHIPAWDGNNESGFSALASGAGFRDSFHRINGWALFWSSTTNGPSRAWFAQLDNLWYQSPPKYQNLYLGDYYLRENGFSIRCVQNQ